MVAEQIVRSLTGRHGEWLPEATDPKADPMEYSGYRYVSEGPFTNWAEKEERDAEEAFSKAAGKDVNKNGMYWTVKKVEY